MSSGYKHQHYTCRIHFPTAAGTWWYYNDTERRLATEQDLRTSDKEKSYVLMYEKCNASAAASRAVSLSNFQPVIEYVGDMDDAAVPGTNSDEDADAEEIEMESPPHTADVQPSWTPLPTRPKEVPRASRLVVPSRSRIVTGFGGERIDDVAADEVRRVEAGVRRAAHRREENERGRMRDWHDNDLERSAGGAWHMGKR